MKNYFIVVILIISLLTACKKESNDNNNLILLLFLGIQPNSSVAFSGNFANFSASTGKNVRALPDGITDVLAISSRNHYHRSKVDSSGNFSLNLNKGFSYIILFIDPSLQVKGYYQVNSYGLNSIPTQYATNAINAGSLQKSQSSGTSTESYTPINNFNIDQFLTETGGLTLSEIGVVGAVSKELLSLVNIDADANGIIDLEEGLYTRLNFSQQWGIPNSIIQSNNSLLDLTYLANNLPSVLNAFFHIDRLKVSDQIVTINSPSFSNCSNSNFGTAQINEGGNRNTTVPNPNVLRGSIQSSTYMLGSFCDPLNNPQLVMGRYELIASNKKLVYDNIEPFKISLSDVVLVPNISFTVENGIVKSLDYQFQKISKNGTVNATDKEVNIVYGSNAGSGIGCADSVGGLAIGQASFNCSFDTTKSKGSVTNCISDSTVKFPSPIGTNFDSYKDCYIFVNNSYGNTIGYSIYR